MKILKMLTDLGNLENLDEKLIKILKMLSEKIFISSNDLSNFNEIFSKDATYDNIKSHKKPGLYSLCRRCTLEKPQAGGDQIDKPPAV